MQERRQSLIAIRSIQVPLILQSVLVSFILINIVLIIAFLIGSAMADPVGRLYLAISIAAVEIICLAGVFFAARKQSNQIVGPIYRIGEFARRIREGDLTARVSTRDGDYFPDQVSALDDAVREIHDRLHEIKEQAQGAGRSQGADLPEELKRNLDWFQTGERS